MGRTIGKVLTVLGLAASFGLSTSGAAFAATGTWGTHSRPEASCDTTVDPGVQVHTPHIEASWVTYPANVAIVGANHVQWVGYRAWLLRWNGSTWTYTDQNGDGYKDHGPLLQTQVANGTSYLPPDQWLNTTTHSWQAGTIVFPVTYSGYYRVRAEYYWYADKLAPSGYDVLDSKDHYVESGVLVISQSWCKY